MDFTLDGMPCVSESTEAYFVALCESCCEKWLHMGKQKAANKKEKVFVDRKANQMESKFIKANPTNPHGVAGQMKVLITLLRCESRSRRAAIRTMLREWRVIF